MSPDTFQNADLYREFIAQNSEGIFRIDFEEPIALAAKIDDQCAKFFQFGFIAEFNEAFSRNVKLPELHDLTNLRLAEAENKLEILHRECVRKFFESDLRFDNFETQQTDENGETKYFLNSLFGVVENGELISVWGTQRDFTKQKAKYQKSEDFIKYFQQTQKIEALGRLAGGIAHDFNNFLAVMMLQNDMLNLQLPANSPVRHRIEEMRKATNNATAMVKQLLAIGRKQPIHPKPTEINSAIKEFSKTLPSVISANIEVKVNLAPDAGVCFVDQNQLIQTLTNLALNAKEAMTEGGILKIETANIVLDKHSVHHKAQSEGSFVQITIADNGVGMDSATLESVFEPFFSTKKSTKGVGLGLATVYGFVKQSKGFIWVESELNQGTTFKIHFPRIDQPIVEKPEFSAENI